MLGAAVPGSLLEQVVLVVLEHGAPHRNEQLELLFEEEHRLGHDELVQNVVAVETRNSAEQLLQPKQDLILGDLNVLVGFLQVTLDL
jgi:hypothetical protein